MSLFNEVSKIMDEDFSDKETALKCMGLIVDKVDELEDRIKKLEKNDSRE